MMNQMIKERREAYVEVIEILKHMDKEYTAKIPLELREFFERNASKEYKFNIDSKIPLEEYKLKDNTINILAMLNLNYWCESEQHKQELLKKYKENDLKYEQELKNKYDTGNLFNKNKSTSILPKENVNNLPQQYKQLKWYQKTYDVIVKLIKRIINKL